MKRKYLGLMWALLLVSGGAMAQQKLSDGTEGSSISTNANAILELASKNKGLLHTRVALVQTNNASPLSEHIAGMMVYNTATNNDVVPGIYYNDGSTWVLASAGNATNISYNPSTYEITFTDKDGNLVMVDFRKVVKANETVTTLEKLAEGRYRYTSEDGTETTINVTQDVINNFDQIVNESNTEVIEQLIEILGDTYVGGNVYYDGTQFTYVDQTGDTHVINVQDIVQANETVTTIVKNTDGTYTYTNEADDTVTIDATDNVISNFENIVNNTNVLNELIEVLGDTYVGGNVYYDGTQFTYVDQAGDTHVVNIQDIVQANETITTIVKNTDGTYTYTNEAGNTVTIDATDNVISNFENIVNNTNVLNELIEVLGDTYVGGNVYYDGTQFTYVDQAGDTHVVNIQDIVQANETLTNLVYDAATGVATYTNEAGVNQTIDLSQVVKSFETLTSVSVDNAAGTLTYVDETGTTNVLNLATFVQANETLTTLAYNTANNELTYTGENGTPVVLNLNEGSVAYNPATNVLTYTDEAGVQTPLNLNNTGLTYDAGTSILSYVNTLGVTQTVDLAAIVKANETLTTLAYNTANNELTYTGENGTPVVLNLNEGSVAYNAATNVLTYTDEAGVATPINLNNTGLTYDAGTSILSYVNTLGVTQTVDLAAIVKANETLTTLAYNTANNELTYTGENGTPVVLNLNEGSVAYNAATNVLTYTDEAGAATQLLLNNTDLAYNETTKILTYKNTLGQDQTVNLAALVVEPWNVRGTADKAAVNTDNIYQMGNVAVGTQQGVGTFHIDAAKNNPTDANPNATQVLDDIIVTPGGRIGIGYNPSDVVIAGNQLDDKVTFQANGDLDVNYSLATTSNAQAIVHRNIISNGTIGARTARPNGTSIAAFEGHTSTSSGTYGGGNLITQQRAGIVLRTGKENPVGGEIWFGTSGATDGGSNLTTTAGNWYRAVMDQRGRWAFGADPNGESYAAPSERLDVLYGGLRIRSFANTGSFNTAERPNYISTNAADRLVVVDANGVLKNKEVSAILPEAVTADNGLTKTVNNIQLGGELSKNTTISLEDYYLGVAGVRQETRFNFNGGLVQSGTDINQFGGEASIRLISPGNSVLDLQTYSGGTAQIYAGGNSNSLAIGTHATVDSAPITFNTSAGNSALSTEKARITGEGDMGIGTGDPSEKLDIAGGNVRIREINTNVGDADDRIVVADEEGVLKTIAQSALVPTITTNNGITKNATTSEIELGGTLNRPTTITADATNTLAIAGLQTGAVTDKIVVADADGVLKTVNAATPKFFYSPSIVLPTNPANLSDGVTYDAGTETFTVNLHGIYSSQFGMTGDVAGAARTAIKSTTATTLPVLTAPELEYFVTYFDNTVFDPTTITLDDAGIMTYKVIPSSTVTEKTYMNIVFKVK